LDTPASFKGSITFLRAVAHGISVGSWNTKERRGNAAPCASWSASGQSMVPADAEPRPAIMRSKVDLPQPDGPSSDMNWRRPMSRLTFCSAKVPLENSLATPRTATTGRAEGPAGRACAAASSAAIKFSPSRRVC
jgi:hypothetical protein